ncbi:MAG: hypothetical protein VKL23_01960 [Cyanobacteriota bacterium]|jgi:hypothetical protein|nr:hypothetical protein [Cyanobacteriota bacterium]
MGQDAFATMPAALRTATLTALVLTAGLGACGPALSVRAGTPAPIQAGLDPATIARRYLGVWALSDNANNLFNVRLSADGRAYSTWGSKTMPEIGELPVAAGKPLRSAQIYQQGRWQPWGNGVLIDYGDGWSDWLLVGPTGPLQLSWAPGADRVSPPENFARAVKLSGDAAEVVGVYRLQPTQPQLPPYTAVLLSNGQVFNSIDRVAGGGWSLQGDRVVIDWLSGWRTVMIGLRGTSRNVLHWAPGADRKGPPSAQRSGERLN